MSFSAFCLNITLFCLQTGTKVACNKVSSKVSQQTYIEWNNDVLCWFSYCTTCSLMALPKPNYTRVENRPLGCCLLRVPVQNLSYDCQFFFFHANQTHLIWKVLHQNLFWNRGKNERKKRDCTNVVNDIIPIFYKHWNFLLLYFQISGYNSIWSNKRPLCLSMFWWACIQGGFPHHSSTWRQS